MILQDWGAFLTTSGIFLFSSCQKWFEKGLENSSKVKVFILGQLSVPVVSFVELVKTGYLMGLFGQTICTVCWISALMNHKGFIYTNNQIFLVRQLIFWWFFLNYLTADCYFLHFFPDFLFSLRSKQYKKCQYSWLFNKNPSRNL